MPCLWREADCLAFLRLTRNFLVFAAQRRGLELFILAEFFGEEGFVNLANLYRAPLNADFVLDAKVKELLPVD